MIVPYKMFLRKAMYNDLYQLFGVIGDIKGTYT